MYGKFKGQLFLIMCLIFLLFFASLIRTSYLPYENLIKMRESSEYFVYLENFENLKNEYEKIFIYFYFNQSLRDFVQNFTIFVRERFELRNIKLKTIFLLASYDKIEANKEKNLRVSLTNLAGNYISKINITFTYDNTSKTLQALDDKKTFETFFVFNISSNADYKLILSYFDESEQNYEIKIPLRIGKSKKIGFWVVSFQAGKFYLKDYFEKIG